MTPTPVDEAPEVDATGEPVHHRLHLRELGEVQVIMGHRPSPGSPFAVCYGAWKPEPGREQVLVRIQSSCVYGEVLGSLDCDCREQLDEAMRAIKERGSGIVLYLNQEGRGAGLLDKARGYAYAQSHGVDSFTAYEQLGLMPDARDYSGAAAVLQQLEVKSVLLLTNNPQKVTALTQAGLAVERRPLITVPNILNAPYLESKRRRGHKL